MTVDQLTQLIADNPLAHAHVVQGKRWTLLRTFPWSGLLFDDEGRPGMLEAERPHLILAEGKGDAPDVLRGAATGNWRFSDNSEGFCWRGCEFVDYEELRTQFEEQADRLFWETIGNEGIENQGFTLPKWWHD